MNIWQLFSGLIVLTLVLLGVFGVTVVADKPSSLSRILIMPLNYKEPAFEMSTFSIDQPEYVVSRNRHHVRFRKEKSDIPGYYDKRSDEYRHYMYHYYWEDYEWCEDSDECYHDDHYDEEKYDCYVINWRGHRTYFDCEDGYWY